jgi:hypothetical protein
MERIKYIKNNGVEEIQIKPKRSLFFNIVAVSSVFVILFLLFEIFIDYSTAPGTDRLTVSFMFALFIISGWGYPILWYFFGKEKLIFVADELHYKKDLFGVGIQRRYDLAKITNPQIIPYLKRKIYNPFQIFETVYAYSKMLSYYGILLSFDYGKQTKYFGFNLEESEAKELLQKIEEYITP